MSYGRVNLPSSVSKAIWFPAGWQKHEEISVQLDNFTCEMTSGVQQMLHKYATRTKQKYRKLSCDLTHLYEQQNRGWNHQILWKSHICTGNVIWSNFKNLSKRKTLLKVPQVPQNCLYLRYLSFLLTSFYPIDLTEKCQHFAVMVSECWSCPAREFKKYSVFIKPAWFWPVNHH